MVSAFLKGVWEIESGACRHQIQEPFRARELTRAFCARIWRTKRDLAMIRFRPLSSAYR